MRRYSKSLPFNDVEPSADAKCILELWIGAGKTDIPSPNTGRFVELMKQLHHFEDDTQIHRADQLKWCARSKTN